MDAEMSRQSTPVTLSSLRQMKRAGEKFTCLTSYDAAFTRLLDEAGVDVILVGDSLGMVIQGHETTVPVTMDDMIYHSRAVAKTCRRPLLMVDMPFMAYASIEQALVNATRRMLDGGLRSSSWRAMACNLRSPPPWRGAAFRYVPIWACNPK